MPIEEEDDANNSIHELIDLIPSKKY